MLLSTTGENNKSAKEGERVPYARGGPPQSDLTFRGVFVPKKEKDSNTTTEGEKKKKKSKRIVEIGP